jgi:hypothetical protein
LAHSYRFRGDGRRPKISQRRSLGAERETGEL